MADSISSDVYAPFSLEGRVAVITGAASGIGREAARVFASAGARLVLTDVDEAGLQESEALVQEAGGTAWVRHCNVAERTAIDDLAKAVLRECGRLEIWVNSAGITLWSDVLTTPQDQAERVLAINMMGTYWCCAAAGKAMKELGKGGAIVNVSSTAGDSPVPGLAVYGMAKAGVNQVTRVCAKEFGSFGVRVNAVVPGWIDTPINASMYRDTSGAIDDDARAAVMERVAGLSPLGMTGEPIDIGLGLLYLASDASRFVTGHLLRISGGV